MTVVGSQTGAKCHLRSAVNEEMTLLGDAACATCILERDDKGSLQASDTAPLRVNFRMTGIVKAFGSRPGVSVDPISRGQRPLSTRLGRCRTPPWGSAFGQVLPSQPVAANGRFGVVSRRSRQVQ